MTGGAAVDTGSHSVFLHEHEKSSFIYVATKIKMVLR
jgi:hypothetical protein